MKDLKSRILKFTHSKRGLYDKGYIEDNWYRQRHHYQEQ